LADLACGAFSCTCVSGDYFGASGRDGFRLAPTAVASLVLVGGARCKLGNALRCNSQ